MNLLHALGDNAFTRLQPFLNNPHVSREVTHLHGPDTYLVVCAHNGHLIAALEFRDRALRNEQCPFSNIGRSADSAVPTGAQNIFRVGESSGYSNGASALIHLAIREVNEPFMGIGIPVGQNQLERQYLPLSYTTGFCWETAVPIKPFLLAGGEIHLDRIDRRNCS